MHWLLSPQWLEKQFFTMSVSDACCAYQTSRKWQLLTQNDQFWSAMHGVYCWLENGYNSRKSREMLGCNKRPTFWCNLPVFINFLSASIYRSKLPWERYVAKRPFFLIFLVVMLTDSPSSADPITIRNRGAEYWICLLLSIGILSYQARSPLLSCTDATQETWHLAPWLNKISELGF